MRLKKQTACLLTAALLLSCLFGAGALPTFAAGENELEFHADGDGTCSVRAADRSQMRGKVVVPAESPAGDTVTVVENGGFSSCFDLTEVELPDTVTRIGEAAFSGSDALEKITLPAGLKGIGSEAFRSCKIAALHIPAQVTEIGSGIVTNCPDLVEITVDAQNPAYSAAGNCLIETGTKTVIAGCKASKIPTGVEKIGYIAFEDCVGLTEIDVPVGVTEIGTDAFLRCTSLARVGLPDGLETLGYSAFDSCKSLTRIDLPDTLRILMDAAFMDSGLTAVAIPASVEKIEVLAFAGCVDLAAVTAKPGSAVYHSADNCLIETETKTLVVGCKNSKIPDGVEIIGESAFNGHTGLAEIDIPAGVTKIETYAFRGCTGLKRVSLPAGLRQMGSYTFAETALRELHIPASTTEIGPGTLAFCADIDVITVEAGNPAYHSADNCLIQTDTGILFEGSNVAQIPDGVRELLEGAFEGRARLASIAIPESVEFIGHAAFAGCTALKTVTLSSPNVVKNIQFDGGSDGMLFSYATAAYLRADIPGDFLPAFAEAFPNKQEVTLNGTAYILYTTASSQQADEETGVQLEAAAGVLPPEAVLTVEPVESPDFALDGADKYTAFDISLEINGSKIQPNGKVKVTLPIPAGYDKAKLTVYRVEADGSKTELPCTVNGDAVTFETDHFSVYLLAEKSTTPATEATESTESTEDAATPPMGENGALVLWSTLFACAAAILLVLCVRRKKSV